MFTLTALTLELYSVKIVMCGFYIFLECNPGVAVFFNNTESLYLQIRESRNSAGCLILTSEGCMPVPLGQVGGVKESRCLRVEWQEPFAAERL